MQRRALVAEVQHRRLGEAADDLVRARDHEVGAGGERVLGQRLVEGHVRAPRLVDDQRARRARARPRRARARPRPRRSTSARSPTRRPPAGVDRERRRRAPRASGSARCPSSGSSSGETNVGRSPESTSASIVLECALRCTTTSSPVVREREAGREVALRGAVDEEPRAARPPRLRREALRLVRTGVGIAPDVDPVGERRDVQRERPLADRLDQPGVGARRRPCGPGTCSRAGSRAA